MDMFMCNFPNSFKTMTLSAHSHAESWKIIGFDCSLLNTHISYCSTIDIQTDKTAFLSYEKKIHNFLTVSVKRGFIEP